MKVFVKTYGCTFNKRDSENIAGYLEKNGFELVGNIKDSNIVVINSCGVKSVTQNKIIRFINDLPKDKKVFVGGCLPRMVDLMKVCPRINGMFDANTIGKLKEVIDEEKIVFSDEKEVRLGKPLKRKNNVAIIPICQGCMGDPCSYCSVWFARGKLQSYSKEDVIKEIKLAMKDGCKKMCLTAQDTGCYGKDIGTTLPSLLKDILALDGDFQIQIGMMNPNFALEYLDELVEIFKDKRILKFLHIPLQSGSNKVLKDMNRKYTIEDFKTIVKKFRENFEYLSISTDIIVGFPTETENDFQKTLDILKELKPDVINLSKFTLRPNTEAAKFKQLENKEIKRRSIEASDLIKE